MVPQVLKKMRLLRLERGFSQQNLADHLNMTQSSYAKIERGDTKLNLDTLFCICDLLQVRPNQLLDLGYASVCEFNSAIPG